MSSDLLLKITEQGKEIDALRLELDNQKLQYETQLKEQKDYYENILAFMPGHIYWLDRNNIFLGCNDLQAKDALLSSRKDIVGKTNFDMIWKDHADELNSINQKVMETRTSYMVEEQAIMSSGSGIWLSQKVPLYDRHGNVIGILGVSLDITELKETQESLRIALEKSQAADRAKSEFLQNMSHDFRNPLSGIIHCAQTLAFAPEGLQEVVPMIQGSAEKLLDLCNGVLELVTAEGVSETDIKHEAFDIKKLAQDLKILLQPSVRAKNIQFILDLENIPQFIANDRIKIERILLNLLSNAIKFTHKGTVTLKIQKDAEEKRDGTQNALLKFSIIDTGIGIPPDKLHRIFERFFKAHPSYEELYKGYGVGLNIVKQYVTLLGGEVTVHSELNKGTDFSFALWFPIKTAQDIQGETETALKPEAVKNILSKKEWVEIKQKTTPTQGQKILFIDDDVIMRRSIQPLLTQEGYQVTLASDIKTAKRALDQEQFALIITDIGLGTDNGLDLVKMYRQKEAGKTRLPIFALTGHGDKIKQECLLAGVDQVLTKPVTSKKLQTAIGSVLMKSEDATSQTET